MNAISRKRLSRALEILAQIKTLDSELMSILTSEIKGPSRTSSAFSKAVSKWAGCFNEDASAIFTLILAQRLRRQQTDTQDNLFATDN
ncbi:MAG: hypothetical protein JWO03_3924 [Bacteroidetes bacterium]|nr:hypothetical protein [Bacteroidota bacterium]